MKIIYPTPANHISAYVRSILIVENVHVTGAFVLPLFANGTPTLLFADSAGSLVEDRQHLLLFGQTVLPQQLLIPENFTLIAFFLQPYALGDLFHVSAVELTDQPLALNLIPGGAALQEHLLNATTTNDRLQLIEGFIFNRIKTIQQPDKRLVYAVDKITRTPGKSILTSLQKELYMTERTFQRVFEQHIGVKPNLFRRINQFHHTFRQINASQLPDFSAATYQNGYADQSHMIRAFKEFTHLTPSAYLSLRPGA